MMKACSKLSSRKHKKRPKWSVRGPTMLWKPNVVHIIVDCVWLSLIPTAVLEYCTVLQNNTCLFTKCFTKQSPQFHLKIACSLQLLIQFLLFCTRNSSCRTINIAARVTIALSTNFSHFFWSKISPWSLATGRHLGFGHVFLHKLTSAIIGNQWPDRKSQGNGNDWLMVYNYF